MSDEIEDPTVVAIDPGGTTGWAVLQVHSQSLIDGDVPILANVEHFASGQFTGSELDQAIEVVDLFEQWPGSALLIEDFILRVSSADRSLLSPVRITAHIEALVQAPRLREGLPDLPIFKQTPEMAMSTATDERLKRWGLYRPGEQHARDATRHAITFIRKMKGQANVRARAWPNIYRRAR